MFLNFKGTVLGFLSILFAFNTAISQEKTRSKNAKKFKELVFFDYRGTNTIDTAFGASIINGDLQDAEFELYFRIGYKRHITDHIKLGVNYSKYNLAFKDVFNEGFMSFDANIEYLLLPYKRFTPFIYAGYGYNASNYFESTTSKVQGAFGIECIFIEHIGLQLFAEYNYVFSDELDGIISGESDDTFFRLGFGLNFYFGGAKKRAKRMKDIKTIINSNLILPDS